MQPTASKIALFLILVISIVSASIYVYWQKKLPLVSPVSLIENLYYPKSSPEHKKIVYGFLPYWNLKYKDKLQINHLTHLAYFALDLNEDGTAHKKTNTRELEPGWNKLNSDDTKSILYQSKFLRQKTVLTVTAMEPDLIESIINIQEHKNNAIKSILDVYKEFNFDGINIDFEYVGEPDDTTINNFTEFIIKIKNACQSLSKSCFVDIDIFGDSAVKKRLWDLEKLHPHLENIIVMAYDYYRKSSTKAGPVAPITGSCNQISQTNCLDQDILGHLNLITKKVPQEKIVLGIPFYGYEWQTASEDFLANTYPKTGGLATYQRVQNLLLDPKTSSLSARWSNISLSSYLVYYDSDKIKQIHFENEQSLKLKTDIVKSTNLHGIAIWALGYEVPFTEIWNPIIDLNKQ